MSRVERVTLAIPYYEAPEMLACQLQRWNAYPDSILEKVDLIMVDDGSSVYPAEPFIRNLFPQVRERVQLFRIKENIPWNYAGARNLLFHVSKPGWVFSTDLDHTVPKESLQALLDSDLDESCYYSPARNMVRVANDKFEYHPFRRHGDSFIITKHLFWMEGGGFNEDFAGYYGGPTGMFRKRLGGRKRELDNVWHNLWNEVIEDSEVKEWNKEEYHVRRNPKLRRLRKKWKDKPTEHLRFNWERVL
jgi:hypothetical protein